MLFAIKVRCSHRFLCPAKNVRNSSLVPKAFWRGNQTRLPHDPERAFYSARFLRRTALSVDIDHKILHGIPILSLLQTLYESGLPRFASLSRVYLKTGNVADSVKRPAVRVCWQFSDIPRRMMICVSSGAAVFMPTGLAS